MSKAFLGVPAVAETLIVEFSSATVFGVTGTVSGGLGTGTLAASPSTNPSGSSVAGFELGGGIVATETLTIAFSSATAFSVTGSSSGVLGTGNLPAAVSASTRFTSPKVSFNVTVGTTPFVAGNQFNAVLFRGAAADPVVFVIVAGRTAFAAKDRFYYELVPNAPTYTLKLPMDLVFEYLGDGSGVGRAGDDRGQPPRLLRPPAALGGRDDRDDDHHDRRRHGARAQGLRRPDHGARQRRHRRHRAGRAASARASTSRSRPSGPTA